MPSSVVKSFAEKSGKSEAEVEALWQKIKAQAEGKGMTGEALYTYVTGTLKKILKLTESTLVEKYLVTEGRYDMNNLADSNSYYKVIKPFNVWILIGHKKSNAYYGSSNISQPIWKKTKANKGDEIHNLVGGLFLVNQDIKEGKVMKLEKPDFAPFERGTKKFQKFDLRALKQIDKMIALKVKYQH